LKITILEAFSFRMIEKNSEKRCKCLGPDVNFKFYKISDCPTLSAFIQYFKEEF
jgi:hypothetical protein